MEWFKRILASGIVVSLLTICSYSWAVEDISLACNCAQKTQYNPKLPESHPDNLCSIQQKTEVNWVDWLLGSSQSAQFHFVDLLELLSSDQAKLSKTIERH